MKQRSNIGRSQFKSFPFQQLQAISEKMAVSTGSILLQPGHAAA